MNDGALVFRYPLTRQMMDCMIASMMISFNDTTLLYNLDTFTFTLAFDAALCMRCHTLRHVLHTNPESCACGTCPLAFAQVSDSCSGS